MPRLKYKFRRNLRRGRYRLKYFKVSPSTKYFFSFHNEWLDSRLEWHWNTFYKLFRYRWWALPVSTKRLPFRFNNESASFFLVDPLYSEEPFDESKVFVDSVPFDDDEYGESFEDPENYFFRDDFDYDEFFSENLFLFFIFLLIFFPLILPVFYPFFLLFLIIDNDEAFIYEDSDYEDEDWEAYDEEEEEESESFEEFFLFSYEGIDDFYNEYIISTELYIYAEFVFFDFFTFDEFFVMGRSWAHKPFYKKFLKFFKFN